MIKELGVFACPLAPVVKALDQSNVAILELENLLDLDRDLFDVEVQVETHHVASGWVEIVKLHFNGILNLKFLDLSIILVEDESREADDGL